MPEDFFSGLSKANFYGQDPNSPDQQKLLDAIENGAQALETRYANPNWFNIAAGFAKPQLGGFTASLGSAAEAMGATEENRRKDLLTASQYRAQVALMKNQMSQNQKANQLLSEAGDNITPKLVQDLEARVGKDHPTVQAAKGRLEILRAQQGLDVQAQQAAATAQGAAVQGLTANTGLYNVERQRIEQNAKLNQEDPSVTQKKFAALYKQYEPSLKPVPAFTPGVIRTDTPGAKGAPSAGLIGGPAADARANIAGAPAVAGSTLSPAAAADSTRGASVLSPAAEANPAGTNKSSTPGVVQKAAAPATSAQRVPSEEDWIALNGGTHNDYVAAMKARAAEPMAVQPSTGYKPPETKYTSLYSLPNKFHEEYPEQKAQNAGVLATAKLNEEKALKEFQPYIEVGQNNIRSTLQDASNQLDALYSDPKALQVISRINNLVRKKGMIATAVDEGAQAQVLGRGFSVGFRLLEPLLANLTPGEQEIAKPYINALGTVAHAKLVLNGENAATGNQVLDAMNLRNPPLTQAHDLERMKVYLSHAFAVNDMLNTELPKASKVETYAPHAAIKSQSKWYADLNKARDTALGKITADERQGYSPKKKDAP